MVIQCRVADYMSVSDQSAQSSLSISLLSNLNRDEGQSWRQFPVASSSADFSAENEVGQ